MSHQSELIATDIDAYLAEHECKDLLRLLTCGSVDDGKSTLIGRLLHDSHLVYEDTLAALQADNATQGHAGEALDLALLTDGLRAEREQGITIDVAYRYFSTAARKFIVADTPGHVQYTRNMVTGASTADLAIVMVDARHGVLPQTRRHTAIAALLGIRHLVVCVNKMDLVGWAQDRYDEIVADFAAMTARLPGTPPHSITIPVAALTGDNVVNASTHMGWYDGPTLMAHLEAVDVTPPAADADRVRLPVQLVTRPDLGFRGFAGTLAAGRLHPGDPVVTLPSGVATTVERIVTFDGDLDEAVEGDAVTVTLADEIDVSRGDVLVGPAGPPMQRSHRVDADLVWMAETPAKPGRTWLLQSVTGTSSATIQAISHRLDVDTLTTGPAEALELNDIARCTIAVDRELLFDPYDVDRTTGSFILIDRLSNATVGAGMVRGAAGHWDEPAAGTLTVRASSVTAAERASRYGQQPATVFLTGLTGAGKASIAAALERLLFDAGHVTVRLDGQNVRQGVSRDLGFTAPERSENLRRVAETAKLLNAQGVIAIAVMLAPDADDRERARDLIGTEQFVEVFVDTPLDICRQRDPGGLYSALEAGAVIDMPGVTSPYEPPTDPDLVVSDHDRSPVQAAREILALLHDRGILR